jgi:hypothetical protein
MQERPETEVDPKTRFIQPGISNKDSGHLTHLLSLQLLHLLSKTKPGLRQKITTTMLSQPV